MMKHKILLFFAFFFFSYFKSLAYLSILLKKNHKDSEDLFNVRDYVQGGKKSILPNYF